jgi:enoyl-CoA hydratase
MPPVLFEKRDSVLYVSLNRTQKLNAINSDLLKALESGLKEYSQETTVKALMLFGQGGCFAAGADIQELTGLSEEGIRAFHGLREGTFALLEHFPSPTFALIERYALGTGLELSLCCDFRICEDNAQLGVPSAKLGIVESYEYISRLIRAVGPFHAKKLVLTGERVDAKTAFSIGLVEEITSSDAIFERADAILDMISKNSAYSMRESKKVIDACAQDPYLNRIDDTAGPMVASLKNEDFIEGTKAFLEKRKATFK